MPVHGAPNEYNQVLGASLKTDSQELLTLIKLLRWHSYLPLQPLRVVHRMVLQLNKSVSCDINLYQNKLVNTVISLFLSNPITWTHDRVFGPLALRGSCMKNKMDFFFNQNVIDKIFFFKKITKLKQFIHSAFFN